MFKADFLKEDIKNTLIKLLSEKNIIIDKIIFFGSFVQKKQKKDSDIDIIIVSRNFRNKSIVERIKLTTGIGRKLVKKFKKPFDLLYYSDEEWEKENFLIINEAKEYGEVLYG